jgi:hypothetical protein
LIPGIVLSGEDSRFARKFKGQGPEPFLRGYYRRAMKKEKDYLERFL